MVGTDCQNHHKLKKNIAKLRKKKQRLKRAKTFECNFE